MIGGRITTTCLNGVYPKYGIKKASNAVIKDHTNIFTGDLPQGNPFFVFF